MTGSDTVSDAVAVGQQAFSHSVRARVSAVVEVSCLCVTQDRPEFWPWLWWNFDKQDHRSRELIVVDSSPVPVRSDDPRVRVVPAPPGTSVAAKRNLALQEARGLIMTWFDDDDWQHPRRLSIIADRMADGGRLVGSTGSWFVDPVRRLARPYQAQLDVIFNGLGADLAEARALRFDETKLRAADTAWVRELSRRVGPSVGVVTEVLSWWLCHRRNLSNPVTKYAFGSPLARVRELIGTADWADTDEQLLALLHRDAGHGTS